jgi:hypothetical protein
MGSPLKIAALVAALAVGGCNTSTPEQEAGALTLRSGALDSRQIQARRYDTHDEPALMAATLGVLQDLGYTINETSAGTGLINGSKDRPGSRIRVSVVVMPTTNKAAMTARVSFQEVDALAFGQQLQVKTITDPMIYQRFFDLLSKSVFLEAHEI